MPNELDILKDYIALPDSEKAKINIKDFEVLNDYSQLPNSEKEKIHADLGLKKKAESVSYGAGLPEAVQPLQESGEDKQTGTSSVLLTKPQQKIPQETELQRRAKYNKPTGGLPKEEKPIADISENLKEWNKERLVEGKKAISTGELTPEMQLVKNEKQKASDIEQKQAKARSDIAEKNPFKTLIETGAKYITEDLPEMVKIGASMMASPTYTTPYGLSISDKEYAKNPEKWEKGKKENIINVVTDYLSKQDSSPKKEYIDQINEVQDGYDFVNYIASTLGKVAPQMGATIASSGATSYLESASANYLSQLQKKSKDTNRSIRDIIEKGDDNIELAKATAVVSATIDMLGIGKLFKGVAGDILKKKVAKSFQQKLLNIPKNFAKGAIPEGTTEVIQTGVENVGSNIGAGRKASDNITEGMADAFLQGTPVAGSTRVISGSLNSNLQDADTQQEATSVPSTEPSDTGTTTPSGTTENEPSIVPTQKVEDGGVPISEQVKRQEPVTEGTQPTNTTINGEVPVNKGVNREVYQVTPKNGDTIDVKDGNNNYYPVTAEYKEGEWRDKSDGSPLTQGQIDEAQASYNQKHSQTAVSTSAVNDLVSSGVSPIEILKITANVDEIVQEIVTSNPVVSQTNQTPVANDVEVPSQPPAIKQVINDIVTDKPVEKGKRESKFNKRLIDDEVVQNTKDIVTTDIVPNEETQAKADEYLKNNGGNLLNDLDNTLDNAKNNTIIQASAIKYILSLDAIISKKKAELEAMNQDDVTIEMAQNVKDMQDQLATVIAKASLIGTENGRSVQVLGGILARLRETPESLLATVMEQMATKSTAVREHLANPVSDENGIEMAEIITEAKNEVDNEKDAIIESLKKKLEAVRKAQANKDKNIASEKDVIKEEEKARKDEVIKKRKDIKERIKQATDRFKEDNKDTLNAVFSPNNPISRVLSNYKLYVELGLNHLEEGAITFTSFSKRMKEDMKELAGGVIDDYSIIKDLWRDSKLQSEQGILDKIKIREEELIAKKAQRIAKTRAVKETQNVAKLRGQLALAKENLKRVEKGFDKLSNEEKAKVKNQFSDKEKALSDEIDTVKKKIKEAESVKDTEILNNINKKINQKKQDISDLEQGVYVKPSPELKDQFGKSEKRLMLESELKVLQDEFNSKNNEIKAKKVLDDKLGKLNDKKIELEKELELAKQGVFKPKETPTPKTPKEKTDAEKALNDEIKALSDDIKSKKKEKDDIDRKLISEKKAYNKTIDGLRKKLVEAEHNLGLAKEGDYTRPEKKEKLKEYLSEQHEELSNRLAEATSKKSYLEGIKRKMDDTVKNPRKKPSGLFDKLIEVFESNGNNPFENADVRMKYVQHLTGGYLTESQIQAMQSLNAKRTSLINANASALEQAEVWDDMIDIIASSSPYTAYDKYNYNFYSNVLSTIHGVAQNVHQTMLLVPSTYIRLASTGNIKLANRVFKDAWEKSLIENAYLLASGNQNKQVVGVPETSTSQLAKKSIEAKLWDKSKGNFVQKVSARTQLALSTVQSMSASANMFSRGIRDRNTFMTAMLQSAIRTERNIKMNGGTAMSMKDIIAKVENDVFANDELAFTTKFKEKADELGLADVKNKVSSTDLVKLFLGQVPDVFMGKKRSTKDVSDILKVYNEAVQAVNDYREILNAEESRIAKDMGDIADLQNIKTNLDFNGERKTSYTNAIVDWIKGFNKTIEQYATDNKESVMAQSLAISGGAVVKTVAPFPAVMLNYAKGAIEYMPILGNIRAYNRFNKMRNIDGAEVGMFSKEGLKSLTAPYWASDAYKSQFGKTESEMVFNRMRSRIVTGTALNIATLGAMAVLGADDDKDERDKKDVWIRYINNGSGVPDMIHKAWTQEFKGENRLVISIMGKQVIIPILQHQIAPSLNALTSVYYMQKYKDQLKKNIELDDNGNEVIGVAKSGVWLTFDYVAGSVKSLLSPQVSYGARTLFESVIELTKPDGDYEKAVGNLSKLGLVQVQAGLPAGRADNIIPILRYATEEAKMKPYGYWEDQTKAYMPYFIGDVLRTVGNEDQAKTAIEEFSKIRHRYDIGFGYNKEAVGEKTSMLISMADKYNFGDHAYAMLGNLLGKKLDNTWKEDDDLLKVGSFMSKVGIKIKDKSSSKQYYFVGENEYNLEGNKNTTSKRVKQEIPKGILIELDTEVKKELNQELVTKLDADKKTYNSYSKNKEYAETAKYMSGIYRRRYDAIYNRKLQSKLDRK